MTNPYYTHTTFPATGSAGSSSLMRAELDSIASGFDKLPTLSGNANKSVLVNSAGDALTVGESIAPAVFTPEIADAASGGNVGSASTIEGWSTRVGQLVLVTVRILNIDTTGLTAGNNLYVRGLPVTSAAKTGTFYYLGSCRVENVTFSGSLSSIVLDGTAYLRVTQSPSGSSTTASQLNVNAFTSGSASLWAQVMYEAA